MHYPVRSARHDGPKSEAGDQASSSDEPLFTVFSATGKLVQHASDSEWERYRQQVSDLYLDQQKPLTDVMEIMRREHGFQATRKQFKTRITKWGLDKRLKAPEVREMLRLKQQRENAGKDSQFFIRGRPVSWAAVDRYVKRHRGLVRKVGGRGTQDWLAVYRCRSWIRGPDNLNSADEIIRIMRDYCQGAIEGGLWTHDTKDVVYSGTNAGLHGQPTYKRLVSWLNNVIEAAWCIKEGRTDEAFRLANKCLDQFQRIAKDQDMHLFFFFNELLAAHLNAHSVGLPAPISTTSLVDHQLQGLRWSIQRYTAEMVQIMLGPRHPLSLLWTRCAAPQDSEEQVQFQIKAVETFLGYFTSLGRPLSSFPYVFRAYLRLLRCAHDKTGLMEYARVLRDPVRSEWSPEKWGEVNPRLELAINLLRMKEFDEAEAVLQPVGEWLAAKPLDEFTRLRYSYYSCAARIQDGRGLAREYRRLLWEWNQFSESAFGVNHMFTLDILRYLIKSMEEAGEADAAAKLRDDHDRRHKIWVKEHAGS